MIPLSRLKVGYISGIDYHNGLLRPCKTFQIPIREQEQNCHYRAIIMTDFIPAPSGYPILGNVLDVDPENPHDSLSRIASTYGKWCDSNRSQEETQLTRHEVPFSDLDCHTIVFLSQTTLWPRIYLMKRGFKSRYLDHCSRFATQSMMDFSLHILASITGKSHTVH